MIPVNVDYVVGTGGIGSGILFKLSDEHTMGRNETRLAELTDCKDYCKLHIILNYIAAFTNGSIPVYAIGGVGDDATGRELLGLMRRRGIDTSYIDVDAHSRTMYAVCFQYPNGEGGNITAQNSASERVSQKHVKRFFDEVKPSKHGIVLSAPEVPVEARLYLLRKGRELGCYNVASLLSSEVEQFACHRAFSIIDLLAVNQDEAQAIATLTPKAGGESDADSCYRYLRLYNPAICVVVTCGSVGAYTYYGGQKWFCPAIENTVLNTAGAGDCFLGTIISALTKRVPLTQYTQDSDVSSAIQLAALSSAMKVACNDTIDFSIDTQSLFAFAKCKGVTFSDDVLQRFFKL